MSIYQVHKLCHRVYHDPRFREAVKADPAFDRLRKAHRLSQPRQQRILLDKISEETLGLPRCRKQPLQVEEFLWLKHLPLLRDQVEQWTRIHQSL